MKLVITRNSKITVSAGSSIRSNSSSNWKPWVTERVERSRWSSRANVREERESEKINSKSLHFSLDVLAFKDDSENEPKNKENSSANKEMHILTKKLALSSSVCVPNPVSPMARHASVPPQLLALLPCLL